MPIRAPRPALAGLAAGTAVVALLAGCSSSSTSPAQGSSRSGSSSGGTSRTANVEITAAKGCQSSQLSFPAGPITFNVANKDATATSEVELQSGERIVGERENLAPGLSGSFSVNIDAGKYQLYCPGAKQEYTTLEVTGKTASAGSDTVAALLSQGTKEYGTYVTGQVGYLVQTVAKLNTALHGTNLAAAQTAYIKARPYYEKIEPVAESFTVGKGAVNNLDTQIDARVNDVPASQFRGFHRIEMGLFQAKSLRGLAPYGDNLAANVGKLQQLTKGLTYQPFELANGAQDLLEEVASSKITGEEERYSLIDILDFEANDEGAEQAFADLQPALQKIDPSLTNSITAGFKSLDDAVDAYRTGSNPSGFELYNELTAADKQKLAAAVKAVQEPLADAASKVAHAE